MVKEGKINIGFFGTSTFAFKAIKKIFDSGINIKFVVTQNPKPSGRGKRISDSPVGLFSKKNNLSLFTPQKLDDHIFLSDLSRFEIDFIVVVAYGKILNSTILNIPKFFCLNIHGSLLPKWRGAAPIQRAILNGDKKTGVSIMVVKEKLDSGPVITKEEINIQTNDNSETIHERLGKIGSELILEALINIYNNNFTFEEQRESEATYAEKVLKSETKIDWSESAETIDRKIRAFHPWPGAWTYLHTNKKKIRIKIIEAKIVINLNKNFKSNGDNLIVKCKDNFLKIKKLQPEGKKIMNDIDFSNGLCNQSFFFE